MAKDKELADHERAHSGVAGSKVRHGADATGRLPNRTIAAYGYSSSQPQIRNKQTQAGAPWMKDTQD